MNTTQPRSEGLAYPQAAFVAHAISKLHGFIARNLPQTDDPRRPQIEEIIESLELCRTATMPIVVNGTNCQHEKRVTASMPTVGMVHQWCPECGWMGPPIKRP